MSLGVAHQVKKKKKKAECQSNQPQPEIKHVPGSQQHMSPANKNHEPQTIDTKSMQTTGIQNKRGGGSYIVKYSLKPMRILVRSMQFCFICSQLEKVPFRTVACFFLIRWTD